MVQRSSAVATHGDYSLGTNEPERLRLLEQCKFLRPAAENLVEQIGVELGWRTLDVACGPLGILDVLAERVLPRHVGGLERELRYIAAARQSLEERGLAEVELVQADATATGLPGDTFDLTHARLLLINVPRPAEVVAEMIRITRPGGYVAFQDLELGSWTCQPPLPEWDRLKGAFIQVFPGDAGIGGQIAGLLSDAGLVDLRVAAHCIEAPVGHHFRDYLPYLVELHRQQILDSDSLTTADLDAGLLRIREHLADANTRTRYPTLLQVWGRKP